MKLLRPLLTVALALAVFAPELAKAATPMQGVPTQIRRGFFTETDFGAFFTLGGSAKSPSDAQVYFHLGGGYDRVVLQEQSTLPVKSPARMHESVRLFDEQIRAAGARTVLYMTWARRHAPETQAAITDAYLAIGRELGADVIPAGLAWEHFLRDHDRPALHDRDGSHPTVAGINGASPRGR